MKKHTNWPLLLLVVVAIALRLWIIAVSPLDPRFSNADDGDYYRRALRFAVTGQYVDDSWLIRPPLHVFFFAAWLRLALLIGKPSLGVLFIQLAQVALGALTILIGWGVARRLFTSNRAGLVFAAFLALWFPFVEQPSVLFSEQLYLFLFLLHILLLLRFDASRHRRDLAWSGVVLGAAALTRSPALYSLAFVILWLMLQPEHPALHQNAPSTARFLRRPAFRTIQNALLVIVCCIAIVGPWAMRNYVVYQRVIPVDTLGPINLWLDLDEVGRRNQHIEELRRLPQAERQSYAMNQVRTILANNPLRLFHAVVPTFLHIWKAQFVEDFFVKRSFFARPLREAAPIGLPGDMAWLILTAAGLIGLASPVREGWHNRLFLLAWLGYSLLTVLIFHVEPRYLLPIWTLIGLYGARTLARPVALLTEMRQHPWNAVCAMVLTMAFVDLVVTYRDYPAIIRSGLAREQAMIAGERAYRQGNYIGAEYAFRTALAHQPHFVDGKVALALALAAQDRHDEASSLLTNAGSRRAELVAAAIARDSGDIERARKTLATIEAIAGENAQVWAVEWLRPSATTRLALGNDLDIGYIAGFSAPEYDASGSFRWLEGSGRVKIPLTAPIGPGATLHLRMASGRTDKTLLDIWIGDYLIQAVPVQHTGWRVYYFPLPPHLYGQRQLTLDLHAPSFIPALRLPGSDDARTLSLMISDIRVEP